jgi:uncharacterized protein YpmB
MKKEDLTIQLKDKTEISIQQKQQKEKQLIGKIIPHKNHIIWEVNNETKEIRKATFEKVSFIIGKNHQNKQIIVLQNHSYISALNKKNALKKFNNNNNGSKF